MFSEIPVNPEPTGPGVHDSEHSDSTQEPEPFQPTESFNKQLAVVRGNNEKNLRILNHQTNQD